MIGKVVKKLKELKETDSRAKDIKSVSLTNNGDLLIGYRYKNNQLVIVTKGLKVDDVVQKALGKAKAESKAGGGRKAPVKSKSVKRREAVMKKVKKK